MMAIKKYLGLVGIVAFAVLLAGEALGCMCTSRSSALNEFELSKVVIVATAVKVELSDEGRNSKFESNDEIYNSYKYVESVTMRVEKVYKGDVKVGDELRFGPGSGSDCRWTFRSDVVGERFLFYLGPPEEGRFDGKAAPGGLAYYPVTCGRSHGLSDFESEDLLFLNKLEQVLGKTRISGRLGCSTEECPRLAGVRITIIGRGRTFTTSTNDNGIFEIYDVPSGNYVVQTSVPQLWTVSEVELKFLSHLSESQRPDVAIDLSRGVPISLSAGRQVSVQLVYEPRTTLSGTVLSPTGRPIPDVSVTAVQLPLKDGRLTGNYDFTDKNGQFRIDRLPAGSYLLVVNSTGDFRPSQPFGTYFFGDTANLKNARPVKVRLGASSTGLNIRIDKFLPRVTLSGTLTYRNGVPVANGRVNFWLESNDAKVDEMVSADTDAEGRFSMKVFKGFPGKLIGVAVFTAKEFSDCPEYLAEAKREIESLNSSTPTTSSVSLSAEKDETNVSLSFAFGGCRAPTTTSSKTTGKKTKRQRDR